MDREQISESLRQFKRLRDTLIHEDASDFHHNLERLILFIDNDSLCQSILAPLVTKNPFQKDEWWDAVRNVPYHDRGSSAIKFSVHSEEELVQRYLILQDLAQSEDRLRQLWHVLNERKLDDAQQKMISIVALPFCRILSDRLSDAAGEVSPDKRSLYGVPFYQIPSDNEIRIFLSHKSDDKPIVESYHTLLEEMGYVPWMDKHDMPAGTELERSILQGFKQSCAVVFFITDSFVDENYLATEIDYAIAEKRSKGKKFAIITLNYLQDAERVPDLLRRYVFINVKNDVQALYEIVRALPIRLGPVYWKQNVIE